MENHKCFDRRRELARIEKPDMGLEDHGFVHFSGSFTGEGWGQGIGLILNLTAGSFIKELLRVFPYSEHLADIKGKPCWITHCQSRIHMIEPLMSKEGATFDIDKWRDTMTQPSIKNGVIED